MNITYILLLLILFSCGSKNDSTNSSDKSEQLISQTTVTEAEMKNIINSQQIDCAGQCPQGVGRLIAFRRNEGKIFASTCTTFTTGNSTIITNHHCIEGALCEDIYAFFPKGGVSGIASTHRCGRVTNQGTSSQSVKTNRDFATLEVRTSIPNTSLAISTSGMPIGEKFEILTNNPNGFYRSSLVSQLCMTLPSISIVENGSTFNLQLTQKTLFTALDCYIIGGNSGSPVINKFKKVTGIIWASIEDSGNKVGGAFNFACLNQSSSQCDQL